MQKTAILVFAALAGMTMPALAQLGPSDPGTAVMSHSSLTGEPSTAPQQTSKLQELMSGSLSSFVDRKPEQSRGRELLSGAQLSTDLDRQPRGVEARRRRHGVSPQPQERGT